MRGPYTKPTEQQVLGAIKEARRFSAGVQDLAGAAITADAELQSTIEYMIDLFTGKHSLNIPEDRRTVRFDAKSSRAADVVLRVVSALQHPPRRRYVPPVHNSESRRRASLIEAHLNALDDYYERCQGFRYDVQALFWQVLTGHCYIQQTYMPHYWDKQVLLKPADDEEETLSRYLARVTAYKAKAGPPIMRQALDPRSVYPVRNPLGHTAYVKIYRVQRYEFETACRQVGLKPVYDDQKTPVRLVPLDPAGLEYPESSDAPSGVMTYYEYIDDEWIFYAVGDRVLYESQHRGAIKIVPAYGLQTGFFEPEYEAVGLLWPVRNEIAQLDFYRTLLAQKVFMDIFPPLVAQLREGETIMLNERGEPREWQLKPGTITQIQGQLTSAFKDATPTVDLLDMLNYLGAEIDLATIPGLLRGNAPQYQSGYSVNQMIAATRTHWKPFIRSRENQLATLDEHYLYIVREILKDSVVIHGQIVDEAGSSQRKMIELDPDMIDEFPHVEVTISPELPVDRTNMAQTWWNLFKEGGASWDDYMREGLDMPDPETRRRIIERDMVRRQMFPQALEAAIKLGQVQLENELLKERQLDKANALLTADIEALRGGGGMPGPENPNAPAGMLSDNPPLPVNPSMGPMPQAPTGTEQLPGGFPLSPGPTGPMPPPGEPMP